MKRSDPVPWRCLWLVKVARWLVPANRRGEWSREWESEIQHACHTMLERGDTAVSTSRQLWAFSGGAFADAVWHWRSSWTRNELSNRVQSSKFCLTSLVVLVLTIVLTSGFLPMTRAISLTLPYAEPNKIATVAQGGARVALRYGIRPQSLEYWQSHSRLLAGAATYTWGKQIVDGSPVQVARVSANFFPLLGARSADDRRFSSDEFERCEGCVVVSSEFSKKRTRRSVVIGPRTYRIVGVLHPDFWFLAPQIKIWEIGPPLGARTGVVVRLKQDVGTRDAERELGILVRKSGGETSESLIEVSALSQRVRSVFGSFALALMLAVVVVSASLNMRSVSKPKHGLRAVLFFGSKTLLLLAAVLLAGLEFTRAPSITMLGGTDLFTEPLSTWLFLLACMGVLSWSLHDQRRRCRVCQRRLGMVARVGCPGCLLLDWAGTELVCVDGHGMLHIPEMASCWHEPEKWTPLDESWVALFSGSQQ